MSATMVRTRRLLHSFSPLQTVINQPVVHFQHLGKAHKGDTMSLIINLQSVLFLPLVSIVNDVWNLEFAFAHGTCTRMLW